MFDDEKFRKNGKGRAEKGNERKENWREKGITEMEKKMISERNIRAPVL